MAFRAAALSQRAMLIREELINGEPGLVATGAGHPLAVISFSHRGGRIGKVWAVRNPLKLGAWM